MREENFHFIPANIHGTAMSLKNKKVRRFLLTFACCCTVGLAIISIQAVQAQDQDDVPQTQDNGDMINPSPLIEDEDYAELENSPHPMIRALAQMLDSEEALEGEDKDTLFEILEEGNRVLTEAKESNARALADLKPTDLNDLRWPVRQDTITLMEGVKGDI